MSFCSVKKRGCCWYFPKFTLVDIQRMTKSLEGLNILEQIKNLPGTVIYRYYIHAKGFFDKSGYDRYMLKGNNSSLYNKDQYEEDTFSYEVNGHTLEDHTIFFRACPFVKSGYGCTLPPRFRTVVCNFFICSEVLDRSYPKELLNQYLEERSRYSAWLNWENKSLEYLLKSHGVDLTTDFETSLKILQDEPMNTYDFPMLEPIIIGSPQPKGA